MACPAACKSACVGALAISRRMLSNPKSMSYNYVPASYAEISVVDDFDVPQERLVTAHAQRHCLTSAETLLSFLSNNKVSCIIRMSSTSALYIMPHDASSPGCRYSIPSHY